MDKHDGLLEMQRSERERNDLSDLGLKRIAPINPATCTEEYLYWLWDRLSTQDYAFDDFSRGRFKLFLEGLLDPGSLHFAIDTRGYIVVRNLQMSDNAVIHYVIWDRNMKFSEIIQCGYEVVNFLFATVKVERITATIPDYNKNASKFATMLGFKFEGEQRNAIVYNDKHYNVRMYGILRSEWINTRYNHARRTKNEQHVDNYSSPTPVC